MEFLQTVFLSLLGPALFLVTLFLVLLILVQRGRGGGLAGALGGMGGESALGTKAGDVFTKITIITALIWILLCTFTFKLYQPVNLQASGNDSTSIGGGSGEDEGDDSSSNPLGSDDSLGSDNPAISGGGLDDILGGGDGSETDETGTDETGTDAGDASDDNAQGDGEATSDETTDTTGAESSDTQSTETESTETESTETDGDDSGDGSETP